MHSEKCPTKFQAQKRECYIKGLTRDKKLMLCREVKTAQ
jgi:predicted GIY-YIG superfamily endonuclease